MIRFISLMTPRLRVPWLEKINTNKLTSVSALRTDRAEYIAGVDPGACGGCEGSAVQIVT